MCNLPVLYSFRRCPYAMRSRMALLVSGTAYEHREVRLRDKPAAMLAVSPKGTVPVLVLPDGTVIDQSLDIMCWALDRHDPEGWLARADLALVAGFEGGFKVHLDRYKYAERYDSDALAHRTAGSAMLGELDARLASHSYLDGSNRGLTDIALFPFVRQFAAVDAEWFAVHAQPAVVQWLAKLLASDLFEQAMVRLAPWEEARV